MSTFTLSTTNAVKTITLNNPQAKYSAVINLSTSIQQCGKIFSIWDNGASFDSRRGTVECVLNLVQRQALDSFFWQDSMPTTGRGADVYMTLGGHGFYPFGPDKGDVGQFTVRLVEWEQGSAFNQPRTLWKDRLTFLLRAAPAYSFPSEVSQGALSVCGVTGLRVPQVIDTTHTLGVLHTETAGGGVYEIDNAYESDHDVAELEFNCNGGKAARLLNALTGASGRASSFTVASPNRFYIFGAHSNSNGAGSYTVKLVTNKINVTHDGFNEFTFKLRLAKVAIL